MDRGRLEELLRKAGKRAQEARREADKATARLRALIVQAHGEGLSQAEIARLAGISRERVRQIVGRGP